MNVWPVLRCSGSFFSWTANKSVWHCGLHNNFSNCRLNSLLGQSFCTDIFLNSLLLFSYFPVPAPDELGWSLLHWFEWAGAVQWARRANLTDWKQYPLHTRHPWPCWCTLLPGKSSQGITAHCQLVLWDELGSYFSVFWRWTSFPYVFMDSVCFQNVFSLSGMHQQSRTKLEKGRLRKGVVFSALDISSVVGKDQKVCWATNSWEKTKFRAFFIFLMESFIVPQERNFS